MYFSEREKGELPREQEEIGIWIWEGIEELVDSRIYDGSFGANYPTPCPDGEGITGTDAAAFWRAMRAEIPNMRHLQDKSPPQTLDILDMIEFCWRGIGKPIRHGHHEYFKHYHLDFNIEEGRNKFREDINRIFRRNGLAYQLTEYGQIERLAPPVLSEELASGHYRTGDDELDRLLEKARSKFLRADEAIRREALDTLWDAWERLKTLGNGSDKKFQVTSLLDDTAGASSSKFRQALEKEARELTEIGNTFQIRHSETNQERLVRSEHVDYLFHRLYSLISLILRIYGKGSRQ